MKAQSVRQCVLISASVLLLTLIGCANKNQSAQFELLPSTQGYVLQLESTSFAPSDVKFAFSPHGAPLPIRFDHTKQIELATDQESAQIVYSINGDLDLKAEGYRLSLDETHISIEAKDEAGLFYGFATLDQLMEDASDQDASLPAVEIVDYPALAFRPIHLDIKHHREKESYYYELIDRLARRKVNGIIVELEDKLKYESRPEVGSEDAFSIQQWIDLSNYAADRHISISPLVQGLGHASFILKHEQNKHLRDDPENDWAFNPLDPLTYELQFDLYLDAIKATPHGKYLHVGGDEVETTGRGSGMSKLELNLIWLNKVTKFAEEQGRIPIFWDDMPLRHGGVYDPMWDREISKAEVDAIWEENEPKLTEFIDQFPKNVIYMRWNYQMPETYGNLKAMDWFSKNGFKVMGATAGQTRFVLMPQDEGNYDAIRSFALSSAELNFGGLLLTLWDDDSPHFELYQRGISTFAEYTWAGDKRSKDEFKQAYRHRTFSPDASAAELAFIDALEGPVRFWKNVLLQDGEDRNLFRRKEDPVGDGIINLPDPINPGQWSEQHAERLTSIKEMIPVLDDTDATLERLEDVAVRNRYQLEVYGEVSALVRHSFDLLSALEKYDLAEPGEALNQATEELKTLRSTFESRRAQFETVYSKTRELNKPADYILDQDHHWHLANQSRNMDWQFGPEMLLLEKIESVLQ